MDYRNRFLKSEIKILLEIKHQNIIQIYQISQFETFLFVIMEFAHYSTMSDILDKNGAFKEPIGQNIFKHIIKLFASA